MVGTIGINMIHLHWFTYQKLFLVFFQSVSSQKIGSSYSCVGEKLRHSLETRMQLIILTPLGELIPHHGCHHGDTLFPSRIPAMAAVTWGSKTDELLGHGCDVTMKVEVPCCAGCSQYQLKVIKNMYCRLYSSTPSRVKEYTQEQTCFKKYQNNQHDSTTFFRSECPQLHFVLSNSLAGCQN